MSGRRQTIKKLSTIYGMLFEKNYYGEKIRQKMASKAKPGQGKGGKSAFHEEVTEIIMEKTTFKQRPKGGEGQPCR